MISDEAVEVAARAMAQFDEWEHVSADQKSHLRRTAKRALTAAAPFIAAQALSDAAEELTGKRLLDKPFHEYYPEWLNKKADTYRSGT